MGEVALAAIYCVLMLGGQPEVTHAYRVGDDHHRIRIDCETEDSVIEVGWDKRSALDSLQQALFAAELTGKRPEILLIDTDGRIGPYETRIRAAAKRAGVGFATIEKDRLIRWQMTAWLRSYDPAAPAGS